MEKNIEVIARAIVIKNDKILLCKNKQKPHYFIPGGHVEFGEKAEITLVREFQEEVGASVSNFNFIGVSENTYTDEKEIFHHEINLTFSAEIKEDEIISQEDHLEFAWIELEKFSETLVKPEELKEKISCWFINKKIFWSSEIK